ncbi:MAG: DUF4330 domain-containing protein [Clostridia bacterium]|nr:DUF4330 domain-containing protein [Clostridia bacterium]
MKIIDKKGKLFGLVNIVDLIVLLLVIAVVGIVATKLMGSKVTDAVSAKTDCWAQIRIIGAHPSLVTETLRQELPGQHMVAGNAYLEGTIEDVWLEDYKVQAVTDDGRIVTATDPDKKDIIVLIRFQVAPDTPSPKLGSQEVRAGRTLIVKAQTFETSGTIRYVEIGGYNPPEEFAKPE